MGDLPDDAVEFIDRHFHVNDVPVAKAILDASGLSTPRIVRAVLLLSNGSLTLLRHYVGAAQQDVRDVLLNAEYVIGVSQMPMPVRDLTLPFWDDRNRPGASARPVAAPTHTELPRHRGPAPRPCSRMHQCLLSRSFCLGQAVYTVANEQPCRDRVRCLRRVGSFVRVVSLPLVFVLEQLAERIELKEAY
jgi:hypothetical protein